MVLGIATTLQLESRTSLQNRKGGGAVPYVRFNLPRIAPLKILEPESRIGTRRCEAGVYPTSIGTLSGRHSMGCPNSRL